MDEKNPEVKKVDPLSYSHRKNPIYMTKTVCGLDLDSTLDIKETIDGVTCPICQTLSAAEPNPADREPNPADNEPNPADHEPDPQKPAEQPVQSPIVITICINPTMISDAFDNFVKEILSGVAVS